MLKLGHIQVSSITLAPGLMLLGGTQEPVSGPNGTGAGKAGTSSLYLHASGVYANVGTKDAPEWTPLTVPIGFAEEAVVE